MAGNAQGIRAGQAFVEIFADDSKLARGLKQAQARLKTFADGVKAAGTPMLKFGAMLGGPIIAAAKSFAEAGEGLNTMSKRTGVTVEALSELKYAASQSDVSMEAFETGIKKMQKALGEAQQGSAGATQALAQLGLTVSDLQGKAPEQQFKMLASQLAQVEDPSRRAALAMELFGKSGTDLLPLMEKGGAGIEELQKEARRLGLTMTTESAQSADDFSKAMKEMWASISSATKSVGAAVAPVLKDVAKWIGDAALTARAWIKDHKELVVTALKVAAAVAGIGLALVGIGKIVGVVSTMIGLVRTAITVVHALAAAFAFLAANPVVLAIAAIVVAVGALIYAIHEAAKVTVQLNDAAHKQTETHDQQRQLDQAKLARLQQLSEKQNLSNDEMAEAKKLTDELNGSYGGLGVAIDGAAKKITVAADAQARLNEEMRKGAISDLTKEIDELTQNQRNLYAAIMNGDDVKSNTEKMTENAKKLAELYRRRTVLDRGDTSQKALTNEGPTDDEKASLNRKIELGKADAQAIQEWQDRVHELELQNIQDEHERAVALINSRYDIEMRKAQAVAASKERLDGIEKARQLELQAEAMKLSASLDDAAQKVQEHMAQTAQADMDRRRTIAALSYEAQGIQGQELQKALLELDRQKALADAKKNGQDPDLVKREYELRAKILEQQGGEMSRNVTVAGTFNASAIQGLQASTSAQDRTAKATEQTAANTSRLLDKDFGAPAFA